MEEFVVTKNGESVLREQGPKFNKLGYSDTLDNFVLGNLYYGGPQASDDLIGSTIGHNESVMTFSEADANNVFSRLKKKGLIVSTVSLDAEDLWGDIPNSSDNKRQWIKNKKKLWE